MRGESNQRFLINDEISQAEGEKRSLFCAVFTSSG